MSSPPLFSTGRQKSIVLLAALIASCLLAYWQTPDIEEGLFAEQRNTPTHSSQSSHQTDFLPVPDQRIHATSLAERPDGSLVAAWLGSQSGQSTDDAIWLSLFIQGNWQKPLLAASRETAAASTLAHVSKLAQPQLLTEGSWLHLWYAAGALSSDLAPRLYYQFSTDSAQHWSPAIALPANTWPFSAAPAGTPIRMTDGSLLLPMTQGLLRISVTGKVIDIWPKPTRFQGKIEHIIQLDTKRALVLLRAIGADQLLLLDLSGQQPRWLSLPDTSSVPRLKPTPSGLLKLDDGRLLLAGNPANAETALSLWISNDQGNHWLPAKTLEGAVDGGADFSAPSLLQARDGQIHLLYAWRQQRLRHLSFTPDQLENR